MNIITELLIGKHNNFYQKVIDIEKAAISIRVNSGFSFVNHLPKKIKKVNNIINGIEFSQGDIVERPMYNKMKKVHLKHYGYYYGTDESGVDYIVNKEADGYIYVRTLKEYMKDLDYSEIDIIKKPEETTIEEIIKRSQEIENEPYTALSNNCQHFVNYSVFGSYNSITTDQVKSKFIDKYDKWKNRKKQ